MSFYKGFIPTNGKQSMMAYKGKSASDLLTFEQAVTYPSFAGVLKETSVLIDVDNFEQGELLLSIVKGENLKCRVLRTDGGYHFLFRVGEPLKNRTRVKLAVGITADIKGTNGSSYQVLKRDGVLREVVYDTEDYETLPKYLYPLTTNMELLNLTEGDGRNTALYSYILPLQRHNFTKEECRKCISIINDYILVQPLSEDELSVVLRDGAFEKPDFFNAKGGFLFDKFARYLQDVENIIKLNNQLYIYKNGIYEKGDEQIESAMIKHIPNLTRGKRQEVLAYLNLLVSKASRLADANLIAFNNGVLDIADNSFHEFSPEYIITNKIPHNYVPDAKSELLDKVMMKLAYNDESVLKLLYQSVGYCCFRRNELRKSFFLLGAKRNGKSTFLQMIENLFGDDNVSNLDLSEIGHEFKTAELTDKLVNVGDDISDEWISNMAIFKKVVSGSTVTVSKKCKDPYKLNSFCKFYFSANSIPKLGRGKDNAAVMDRLVIIPFDNVFTKNDKDYDPFIKYKLRDEEVMEALIAKAIPALREVLANQEFEIPNKVKTKLVEFEKSNNPILEFFDELEESDYLNEPAKNVYQRYNAYCISNNLNPFSAYEFHKQMKDRFDLGIKIIEMSGKKVRVYVKGE